MMMMPFRRTCYTLMGLVRRVDLMGCIANDAHVAQGTLPAGRHGHRWPREKRSWATLEMGLAELGKAAAGGIGNGTGL